jgi:hypothetical protein
MKIIRQLGFGIFGFGGDSEPNNKKIRVHSERIEEKHQENRGFESGEKRKEFFRRSVRALLTSLPGDPRSTPNQQPLQILVSSLCWVSLPTSI